MNAANRRQLFANWSRIVPRSPKKAPRARGARVIGPEAERLLTKLGWSPGIFILEKTTEPLGLSVRWRTSMREQRFYPWAELEKIQKTWVDG